MDDRSTISDEKEKVEYEITDYRTTISAEEKKTQDKVIKELLSDQLINHFDPTFWSSPEDLDSFWNSPEHHDYDKFIGSVFPILVRYHDGEKLDELIRSHQWLTDMAIPSKRSQLALIFQKDPARNLTILDLFAKLKFLKIWGSAAIYTFDPMVCICCEMFKIIRAKGLSSGGKAAEEDRLKDRVFIPDSARYLDIEVASEQDLRSKLDRIQQDFKL